MNRQGAVSEPCSPNKGIYFIIPVLLYAVAVLALSAVHSLARVQDGHTVTTPFGETYPYRAFCAGHYLVAGVSFGCGMMACLLLEHRGEVGYPLFFLAAVAVQAGVVAASTAILYPPIVSLPMHGLLIFQLSLLVIGRRRNRNTEPELRAPLRPNGLPSVPEGTTI
jgi:hypothetical protein